MQITSGVRSILSKPIIYEFFQNLMGAESGWKLIVSKYLKPKSGDKILDVGCGPADVLRHLTHDIEYWGFDISPEYIKSAQKKYGGRGTFTCKLLDTSDLAVLPEFDIVLLSGVFHHMDDDVALGVVKLAHQSLKSGGRLVSVDPCYTAMQNPLARFLISKDRGQNVRDESGYRQLVGAVFAEIELSIVHKVWIPYTHCYMVCRK